ncbi:transducin beta-like protein 2 isoform X4 [Ixodes scapularis]|uniref:transducin beta-like protein 2 isoform X4 n=1 Tax=Ixodes scapularis TaxID=6945 RepID=UPI001C38F847|nr:transducin beta-like protein 2 isoform X4 [Ixodes scapularis]
MGRPLSNVRLTQATKQRWAPRQTSGESLVAPVLRSIVSAPLSPSEADKQTARKENRAVPKRKKVQEKKRDIKTQYLHPWLMTTLKGHSGNILDLDFNVNGKFLATSADDRVILLWCLKNLAQKEHKSVRVNVEYDHATRVRWSPDSRAIVLASALGNAVQVYRVGRREDGSPGNVEPLLTFKAVHQAELVNVGIACNGHFIMSISKDTTLCVWSLKGDLLATLDTRHMNNYYGCVSPCGRFVASSGFTPDVKVWEVCFSKTGEFKEVKRAFELKGHTSGVFSFAFSNDSTRMASVSRDGTWKLWDCNIEYQKGQEPYLLTTGEFPCTTPSCLALSPDGRTVAIANEEDIHVFCGRTGSLNVKFEQVHSEPIVNLQFSPNGSYLAAAVGKHVLVFHNVPGFQNTIGDLEERKKNATNQSIRDRLQLQIDEARSALKSLQLKDS